MKKHLYYIIIISVLVLLYAGCKKNLSVSNVKDLYFQMDYLNYAWGYQHNGFIIKGNGEVLVYNNPEKWNFPDNNYMLTAEQVEENLGMCHPAGVKISGTELARYASHISNIASSKVSAPRNIAADEGTTQFICYETSGQEKNYKGYLIKMEGDFTCENLNFFSKKVVTWMKDISHNLPRN
jgi:uncharacterized Fe-S cluster protein YjdI